MPVEKGLMSTKEASAIAIGLSDPSKMPCRAYSIPTRYCVTGGKLRGKKGSVCEFCFADLRGNYRFTNVQDALEKRYQTLAHPLWVDAMVTLIRNTNKGDTRYFRWHDSGDLQGESHLANICETARRMPDVSFWLPTKEWKLVREYFRSHEMPDNLTVRLSMPNVDQIAPIKDDLPGITYSEVISEGSEASNGQWVCPSENQGNKCLDCRACWKRNNRVTTYHQKWA